MAKTKIKERRTPFTPLTVIMCIILTAYSALLIILLLWGVITALKHNQFDFRKNPYQFPNAFSWGTKGKDGIAILANIKQLVFDKPITAEMLDGSHQAVALWSLYANGFLYALGCAFVQTAVACVTAYFCARYKYKFSKIMYATVLIVMIVPIVGSLPSEIQMAKKLRLYNQMWGLWIMKANFLGMYFLVFHEYFKGLPDSYTEAAKIDGAGNVSILLRIGLPLAKNLFLTVLLINFITYWNDYQTPLVYLRRYPTIAYAVFQWTTGGAGGLPSVPVQMTATALLMVPILILFICCNQRLLGNLTIGGIKG